MLIDTFIPNRKLWWLNVAGSVLSCLESSSKPLATNLATTLCCSFNFSLIIHLQEIVDCRQKFSSSNISFSFNFWSSFFFESLLLCLDIPHSLPYYFFSSCNLIPIYAASLLNSINQYINPTSVWTSSFWLFWKDSSFIRFPVHLKSDKYICFWFRKP